MIKLANISKKYSKEIFHNFNCEFSKDKITVILGESGVGKSTLLKIIANMIKYDGQVMGVKNPAFVFQEDRLVMHLTVYENIKLVNPNASEARIAEILDKLEIIDKKDSYPAQLSGGEAKRTSIARAILYNGDCLLMDEPFNSLDISLKFKLIKDFNQIWSQNPTTVIFVTHDIDEAMLLADDIYILAYGIFTKHIKMTTGKPRHLRDLSELKNEIYDYLIN